MNRKMAALGLGVVTALVFTGCASKASSGNAGSGAQGAQRSGRGGQFASDPQLQQMMQDQRQDQQQISQLMQQIDTDAGLPQPADQNNSSGTYQGNGGQGQGGQPPQGQAPQGQSGQSTQDIQAAKDLMTQEHQAATDLVTRLTDFDNEVKQAAGNQKALKDAQTLFTPIEASLPARGRGFFGGGGAYGGANGGAFRGGSGGANGGGPGRNLPQGIQARIDQYKAATTQLDAAIAQLKTDLGQK